MRIVVDATHCSDYALAPLPDGRSAFERLRERVDSFQNTDRTVILTDRVELPVPSAWARIAGEDWTLGAVLEAIASLESNATDPIAYVACDTPFLDVGLAERMASVHSRYYADVSFQDGYPDGVAPLLLNGSIIPTLQSMQEKHSLQWTRTALLDLIQKDINAFDVETELSPTDLRYLRLTLAADSKEGFELCSRFAQFGPDGIEDILRIATENAEILRLIPAYLTVQVVEQESQELSYSPYRLMRERPTAEGRAMPVAAFRTVLDQFRELNPSGTVGISLWGELALHPDPVGLIDAVGATGLSLVCETSGVGFESPVLEALADGPREFLTWIVGLDAVDPEVYRSLRGEGFEEAMAFVDWALSHYSDQTYIQAVRLTETEEHLEEFYRTLKERTDHIIIQKYDYFCGALPQRKVTDISPVLRRPCWHLKRDLAVLVDGTVPLCREDLHGENGLGNAYEDGLSAVWARGEEPYRRHVQEDYPSLCERCDEYYTFNF